MSATAAMAARLRRMVDESTEATYTDEVIDEYIERYPLLDVLGQDPQEVDLTTTPPTISESSDWIPTYDLHAAAADIWEEKASAIADEFTFSADGGSFKRGEKYNQYMGKARHHLSKRSVKTIKAFVEPRVDLKEATND